MIEITQIYKSYEKAVLKNVSLSVKKGDFVALLGRSGSGKSTLLKMINALVYPDGGEIRVFGKNLSDLSGRELMFLRRKIGYVMQDAGLFPHLKVGENIAFVSKLTRVQHAKQKVRKLSCMLGIEALLDRYPDELSGGQRQRVGIARALFNEPEILLFDEPFSALDSVLKRELQSEIKGLASHKACVFVTHDVSEAMFLANRIVVLEKGEIVFDDSADKIALSEDKFIRGLFRDHSRRD
ncbi:ATP-binding cassette domain-containing protein [Campylobacter sp. 19-13652]|uniref:ATP-binding cassette domain-containing protein n=1 Tax=Campylobacter sp. 19-13652 TaxID=2840180 RepID=UPI001C786072|nr:ATP-binding cassette domain-containing protein [Campylobacter sp. 19-13652]BCX78932.1 hypothetical protein LBC_03940 [Campylobacter sp. 19-13652]